MMSKVLAAYFEYMDNNSNVVYVVRRDLANGGAENMTIAWTVIYGV